MRCVARPVQASGALERHDAFDRRPHHLGGGGEREADERSARHRVHVGAGDEGDPGVLEQGSAPRHGIGVLAELLTDPGSEVERTVGRGDRAPTEPVE